MHKLVIIVYFNQKLSRPERVITNWLKAITMMVGSEKNYSTVRVGRAFVEQKVEFLLGKQGS